MKLEPIPAPTRTATYLDRRHLAGPHPCTSERQLGPCDNLPPKIPGIRTHTTDQHTCAPQPPAPHACAPQPLALRERARGLLRPAYMYLRAPARALRQPAIKDSRNPHTYHGSAHMYPGATCPARTRTGSAPAPATTCTCFGVLTPSLFRGTNPELVSGYFGGGV
jgi:hypothetical protein